MFRRGRRVDLPGKHDKFGFYLVCAAAEPVKSFFDALNLCGPFFRVAGFPIFSAIRDRGSTLGLDVGRRESARRAARRLARIVLLEPGARTGRHQVLPGAGPLGARSVVRRGNRR